MLRFKVLASGSAANTFVRVSRHSRRVAGDERPGLAIGEVCSQEAVSNAARICPDCDTYPWVRIEVRCRPAPQGSKKAVGRSKSGKILLVESSKHVAPFRDAVCWMAQAAMQSCGGQIRGPIAGEMTFSFDKPDSVSKRVRMWPDGPPDLDKIERAVNDALTLSGIWEDDSRLVECHKRKVYVNEHPDALDVPGVVIRLEFLKSKRSRTQRAAVYFRSAIRGSFKAFVTERRRRNAPPPEPPATTYRCPTCEDRGTVVSEAWKRGNRNPENAYIPCPDCACPKVPSDVYESPPKKQPSASESSGGHVLFRVNGVGVHA